MMSQNSFTENIFIKEKESVNVPDGYHPNGYQDRGLHSYYQLSQLFEERFNRRHFPEQPQKLYDAS